MKKASLVIALAFTALFFSACPPPADNTNTNSENTNTNTATESPKELATTLADLEKGAYDAVKSKNGQFFEGFLADGFVGVGRFGRGGKAEIPKRIADNPCNYKSISTSDAEAVELGDGVALLTMKLTEDGECGGKAVPSPQWVATIYVKDGDSWKAAYHQTVPAPDAKGEPAAQPEGVKDTPPADADAELTAALSEKLKAGWEAWSKNDAKWFEDNTSADYVSITATEGRSDRATRIKFQGEHKCEVKSITHDGQRTTKFSDNVVLVTYKSMVEGTCDGNAMPGAIWSSSIFVKEGDTWKPAFYMGTPGG